MAWLETQGDTIMKINIENLDIFLGKVSDYQGCHFIADRYYTHDVSNWIRLIDILALSIFPITYISFILINWHFCHPNCDCEQFQRLQLMNKYLRG